jgi:hypothetical protein
MVGQDHERVDVEGVVPARLRNGIAQRIDPLGEQTAAAVEQIGGEEPASARDEGATVVGHGERLS